MTNDVLRVCFPTIADPEDPVAFSGTVYQMARALERRSLVLDPVGRLQHRRLFMGKVSARLGGMFTGSGRYHIERTLEMARRMAGEIGRHLDHHPANVVFSPSSIPLAMLEHDTPKVFFTDATFKGLRTLYPEMRDYPADRVVEGEELERLAIERCDRLIYTSDWAADSAIRNYGADPAKVRVVARGGDLGPVRSRMTIARNVDARSRHQCELLLVGVSWERKGGALAAEVLDRLCSLGIDSRLTIVGCEPPPGVDRSRMDVRPFLDKGRDPDLNTLLALYERSHFLLVPSMAECFGIVYAEASGMGVPSLARDTGGVTSAVRNGINGMVFPAAAGAERYAEFIAELWSDRTRYEALCLSAHEEFLARLNWDVVGSRLEEILLEVAQ